MFAIATVSTLGIAFFGWLFIIATAWGGGNNMDLLAIPFLGIGFVLFWLGSIAGFLGLMKFKRKGLIFGYAIPISGCLLYIGNLTLRFIQDTEDIQSSMTLWDIVVIWTLSLAFIVLIIMGVDKVRKEYYQVTKLNSLHIIGLVIFYLVTIGLWFIQ